MKKIIALLLLAFMLCISLLSCAPEPPIEEPGIGVDGVDEPMDLSVLELSEYVDLGDYKNMTVSYDPQKESKGDAAWSELLKISTIKKYPDRQVAYYFYQKRTGYEHMAKAGGVTYAELIDSLGITEEMMLSESKQLTAEDLVFVSLVKTEKIQLTQADKDAHFEKYVELFVSKYGYTESYVREYLEEKIYETMLYDKTLEALISFTEFAEIGGEE